MRCIATGCRNEGLEDHHVLPVEFGGPMDGTTVPLCPTHHDEIHRMHRQVIKNKLAISSIGDPILRELVNKINEQYLVFQQEGIAPDARRRVVIHCTQEELNMVHRLRDSGGFTGIEVMIKTWIHVNHDRLISGK